MALRIPLEGRKQLLSLHLIGEETGPGSGSAQSPLDRGMGDGFTLDVSASCSARWGKMRLHWRLGLPSVCSCVDTVAQASTEQMSLVLSP